MRKSRFQTTDNVGLELVKKGKKESEKKDKDSRNTDIKKAYDILGI